MAVTTAPLIWDFYRTVPADELGGVVHYYDEQSQSIYLSNGGLSTKTAPIPEGHWETASPGSEIDVTEDSFDTLRLDHPSNGILYGAATDGDEITFLRYVYAMDLSSITESCSWVTQVDNPIAQLSANIMNVGADVFQNEVTLFQPGARLRLQIHAGTSEAYPIGIAWLDETSFRVTGSTVAISGRNSIGHFLKDQTFDDVEEFEGVSSEQVRQILEYAGLTNFRIQPGTGTQRFIHKPSDTLLGGLQQMLDFYTYPSRTWEIVELPDGMILVGYDYWVSDYQPNSYYTFDEGRDVFSRNTRKSVDAAYTAVRITGRDENGDEHTPVTLPVQNWRFWNMGAHKTKHIQAPDGMTAAEFSVWANYYAEILQYVGIGEEFTGPLRPQLLVGDVAEVRHGDTGTALGIITEVRHTFGRADGFKTSFSVDSGGVATDGDAYVVYSKAASLSGYNRQQRMMDLIRAAK